MLDGQNKREMKGRMGIGDQQTTERVETSSENRREKNGRPINPLINPAIDSSPPFSYAPTPELREPPSLLPSSLLINPLAQSVSTQCSAVTSASRIEIVPPSVPRVSTS